MKLQLVLDTDNCTQIIIIAETDHEKSLIKDLPKGDYELFKTTSFTLRQSGYMMRDSPSCGYEVAFKPKEHQGSERIQELENAMQTFVDRCDKGEVKSKKTYSQFKKLLEK